jgi:hypothetical protein
MVEYLRSLASFTANLMQLCIAYDKQILDGRSAKESARVHLSVQRMLFKLYQAVHVVQIQWKQRLDLSKDNMTMMWKPVWLCQKSNTHASS